MNTSTSNQSPCTPKHQTAEDETDQNEWSATGNSEVCVEELVRCVEQGNAACEADENPKQDSEQCDDDFH